MDNKETRFMIDCHRYAELVVAEYQLSVLERAYHEDDGISFDITVRALFGAKGDYQDA